MPPTRFLADEMLGRLARYLRFAGYDVRYARGESDEEIRAAANREGRVLLTRDRALARRVPGALLLTSPHLAEQWKAVRASCPEVRGTIAFQRCTVCNGPLGPYATRPGDPRPDGVPWSRVERGLALYRCERCGHLYWEGTHSARVRADLERWSEEAPK